MKWTLVCITSMHCLFIATVVLGQQGDLKDNAGHVQKETWKNFDVPAAPILTPSEALKRFTVQDGFRLEVLAAEPLVNDPVAISWDADGKLYVAEMWTFMPDPDGNNEDIPNGRVVVLEDIDHDGQMDRSTVFLDKLVMPRAVSVVKGGVLIAEPPNLWFCADDDKNNVCDEKIKVADYAASGSVEHSENGLLTNIDNWIYNARSKRKFKWDGQQLVEKKTAYRGQWGLSMDSYGRLYTANSVTPLMADIYPYYLNNRNEGASSTIGQAQQILQHAYVYANRTNTGINRGYHQNALRKDGRLNTATAASGPGVYRGDKYPSEYNENAFFTAPAANLVGYTRIKSEGLELLGEHVVYPDAVWDKLDIVTSTDERFRPVSISTGPDGYLYIVDMYRGIIQHREFLTTFLRKQIIERELDKPVGLGRIYRLVKNDDKGRYAIPKLSAFSERKLVHELASDNGWRRDTAQRLLVSKPRLKKSTIKRLRKLAKAHADIPAIHALWVLESHQAVDVKLAELALKHPYPWVRIHAMRVSEHLLARAKLDSELSRAFEANFIHNDIRVRLQAYQSLAVMPDDQSRIRLAAALYRPDSQNPHFVDAVVSSLAGLELPFIEHVRSDKYRLADKGRASLLKKIVRSLYVKKQSNELLEIFEKKQSTSPPWVEKALIVGLMDAGADKSIKKITLIEKPSLSDSESTENESRVGKSIEDAFLWPGKEIKNPLALLSADQKLSIDRGKALYMGHCASCHQENGQGLNALAPPLSGSRWVNGSPKRLALIVYHGIAGPIWVKGKQWNSVMPGHGRMANLRGEALADLLSYIRSSWANQSGPVAYNDISSVVHRHWARAEPWTLDLLEKAY